jgi:outer membrane protein
MRTVLVLLFSLLALSALPAAAQQFKLGYVNIDRIERDSNRPRRGAEMLRKEFAAREQATKDMQEKVLAMKAELEKLPANTPAAQMEKRRRAFAERVQNLEQSRRTLVEDVDRRRAEERQKFFEEVAAAVQKIAESQKVDLVLQQGVYASRAIDITDQVLKVLEAAK